MMKWRGSPWLAEPGERSDAQRALHEAALALLDEHEATGRPYALYLRTFAFRQLYCHRLDASGQPIDDLSAVTLDEHLRQWLGRRGVGILRVQDVDPVFGEIFDSGTPALLLRSETWLDAVESLIGGAELIVSECQALTPGVITELQKIPQLHRADRTVLVLPSPPIEFVGNERDVYEFGRGIHQHELDQLRPARSAVFRDLIARAATIARVAPEERLSLIRERRLDQRFPVPYRTAAAAALRLANLYAAEKNVGATSFAGTRAVKIVERGGGELEAVSWRLRLSDLCAAAGNDELALVELDEANAVITKHAEPADARTTGRLTAAARRRRRAVLSAIFQRILETRDFANLWRWANSQGASALGRQDLPVFAQCMSWMAAAAVGGHRYEQAKDHATDAIGLARQSHDRPLEGFAQVYLAHAWRGLGQFEAAARAYNDALQLLPKQPSGIGVVALLGMADVSKQLAVAPDAVATLYQSALEAAQTLGLESLAEAAKAGMKPGG